MNKRKEVLRGCIQVMFLSLLLISCTTDDDAGGVIEDFKNASFITNESPTFFIESDGKVTLTVSGSFEDGNSNSIKRGFVYATSPNPTVTSVSKTVDAIGPGDKAKGKIMGLNQNTEYYIRGFIQNDKGDYFYGNVIKVTTVKEGGSKSVTLEINPPIDLGITIRSAVFSVAIKEMIGEAPVEVGVQYSTNNDFKDFTTLKSSESQIILGGHGVRVWFLNPTTKYYFRPYVKYRDNSVLVGEDKTIIDITTKDLKIGDLYPLTLEDFSSAENSRYIVFEVDQNNRTALLVRKSDIISILGWQENYVEQDLEVRNPSIEEIKKMKELDKLGGIHPFFWARFNDFENIELWTSEEDGSEKAFTYNPITEEKKAVVKTNKLIKTRFVAPLKF